jgi:hypothetical protein
MRSGRVESARDLGSARLVGSGSFWIVLGHLRLD